MTVAMFVSIYGILNNKEIAMRYQGNIYRPPYEANGLLIQVTLGCTHGKCTYCAMYDDKKFKARPFEEIEEDLIMARKAHGSVPSVFLMDANVLALSMDRLLPIYRRTRELFPEVQQINMYARYSDILRKSPEELLELKRLGLSLLTVGMESGSDAVLRNINKGFTSEDIIKASAMLKSAGIAQFTSIILGLGGISGSYEHTSESIRVLNEIKPEGLGIGTLSPQEGTPLYDAIKNGSFELPTNEIVYGEHIRYFRELNLPSTVFMSGFRGPPPYYKNGIMGKDADSFCRAIEDVYKLNPHAMKQKILLGAPF